MTIIKGLRRRAICGSAIVALGLFGLAIHAVSAIEVDDAKASSIRGGLITPDCTGSSTTATGTFSCISATCPKENLRGIPGSGSCVSTTASCGTCECTYSGSCS